MGFWYGVSRLTSTDSSTHLYVCTPWKFGKLGGKLRKTQVNLGETLENSSSFGIHTAGVFLFIIQWLIQLHFSSFSIRPPSALFGYTSHQTDFLVGLQRRHISINAIDEQYYDDKSPRTSLTLKNVGPKLPLNSWSLNLRLWKTWYSLWLKGSSHN